MVYYIHHCKIFIRGVNTMATGTGTGTGKSKCQLEMELSMKTGHRNFYASEKNIALAKLRALEKARMKLSDEYGQNELEKLNKKRLKDRLRQYNTRVESCQERGLLKLMELRSLHQIEGGLHERRRVMYENAFERLTEDNKPKLLNLLADMDLKTTSLLQEIESIKRDIRGEQAKICEFLDNYREGNSENKENLEKIDLIESIIEAEAAIEIFEKQNEMRDVRIETAITANAALQTTLWQLDRDPNIKIESIK